MNNTISPDMLLVQMRAMASQAQNKQAQSVEPGDQTSFAELLKQSIDSVNETKQEGARLAEAFQKGDPDVQLSQVMVALEKSSVSFQAMMEVRNRLVSAYQEVMNMPV